MGSDAGTLPGPGLCIRYLLRYGKVLYLPHVSITAFAAISRLTQRPPVGSTLGTYLPYLPSGLLVKTIRGMAGFVSRGCGPSSYDASEPCLSASGLGGHPDHVNDVMYFKPPIATWSAAEPSHGTELKSPEDESLTLARFTK